MRIAWIDDLKGLGIVLVVVGHAVATVKLFVGDAEAGVLLDSVFSYIYSFHVPLFFFLSGLTYSCGDKGFFAFAKKKFWRLMIPYLVWGFVSAGLFAVWGREVVGALGSSDYAERAVLGVGWWRPFVSILHGGGWPEGKGFAFNGALWFLPVLFSCELLYYPFARRCWRIEWLVIFTSVAVAVITPFYWEMMKLRLPYGITWAVAYLPYVALGDWYGRVSVKGERLSKWMWIVPAVALGALQVFSYRYLRAVFLALATIVPLSLIARIGVLRAFSRLSSDTIAIMVFHKFGLVVLQVISVRALLPWTAHQLMTAVVLVVVFSLVVTVGCCAVAKVVARIAPWSLGIRACRFKEALS